MPQRLGKCPRERSCPAILQAMQEQGIKSIAESQLQHCTVRCESPVILLPDTLGNPEVRNEQEREKEINCPLSELLHLINIPSPYLGFHYLFLIRSIFHLNFVSSTRAEDEVFNHTIDAQCLSSFPVTGIKCHCQQPPSDSHFQRQEQEPVPAQIPNK